MLFLEDRIISLLTGAGGAAERVTEFLLIPNISVLLALGDSGSATTSSEVVQAFTTLAVYAMVLLAVTIWRFHRRDVVAD